MKIAVFHNLPLGGAKRVLDRQVKHLSQKHEVRIFTLDWQLYGHRLKRDFDNFFHLSQKHKKLAERIDGKGFDVCLVHPDKLTQAPFLLRYLRTPSIYYCHELLRIAYEKELAFKEKVGFGKVWYERMTRLLRKRIDRDNARQATKILVNSKFVLRKVRESYGVKAKVCYPGVDAEKFKIKNLKLKNRSQLLFVGEPTNINGYSLARRISTLVGVNLKVISGFKLTDRELVNEYSRSICTLCLSHNEPFGLVPLESMACGTCVLAVNEGGYKETILDGKTGFLLRRDPKEFAKKIVYLIEHPEVAEEMGKAGRRHVKLNFNWKKHVKCLEKEIVLVSRK